MNVAQKRFFDYLKADLALIEDFLQYKHHVGDDDCKNIVYEEDVLESYMFERYEKLIKQHIAGYRKVDVLGDMLDRVFDAKKALYARYGEMIRATRYAMKQYIEHPIPQTTEDYLENGWMRKEYLPADYDEENE